MGSQEMTNDELFIKMADKLDEVRQGLEQKHDALRSSFEKKQDDFRSSIEGRQDAHNLDDRREFKEIRDGLGGLRDRIVVVERIADFVDNLGESSKDHEDRIIAVERETIEHSKKIGGLLKTAARDEGQQEARQAAWGWFQWFVMFLVSAITAIFTYLAVKH